MQPADSKAGEAAAHGAGCQRASCRPSCETDLQGAPAMLDAQNSCMLNKTTANPHYMKFTHTGMHTDTNAHDSHPEKECLQLNQICHIQFGVKISTRLAASSESQHICRIPNRVKTQAIFQAVTLQSLCSFPNYFSPWQLLHRNPSHGKMH